MHTGFLCDPFFELHDTGDHPENPARLAVIRNAVKAARLLPSLMCIPKRIATESEICLVHAKKYFHTVKHDIEFGAGELSTGDTLVSEHSLEVAQRATGGVLNALDAVLEGHLQNALVCPRPPGHHATPARGMGFCIFNHVAIAARYAQKKHGVNKILIVDFDVHHGNGTQDAFYDDPSVLFFSSHQHPWYPGTGMRNETGTARGLGLTVNAPLPAGSGLHDILGELETRLEPTLHQFKPELILLSAGFDSRRDDPLGQFTLTDHDFITLTKLLKNYAHDYAGGRLLSILEGGYNLQTLGPAVTAHLKTLME